ncbi:MAG: mechanosensitive ion channel family protein [Thermoanaerobaculaceae bacterium]|jgi:small-conductance mechanosensitive channel/CRP-like cAMP-binding protein|nr:mechanosensitive ion channel family protein [Thermoanaerobaculaceae bacterium]
MSELSFLLLAGGTFGILALGRVLRSQVVRRLAAALALVCFAALLRWGLTLADGEPRWEEWANVALLLALGYLTARAAMLLLFDWLLDRRMGVKVPRLARDVVAFVVYLLLTAAILRGMLGVEVTALLATSAVITVVIGLALQETLGTLLAGLALSSEQRLALGWWVDVDGLVGEVEELGWRALVLRTTLGERVLVPNSQATRARMRVLGKGEEPVAVPVELGVAYEAEPDRVKRVLDAVANDLPLVAGTPRCKAFVRSFGDSSIHYQVRLWTHQPWREADLRDDFLSRAYAALGREGMEIPFPQRVLHVRPRPSAGAPVARIAGALGACPLFAGLPEDGLRALAEGSHWLTFEPGEAVVREGEASRALYVVGVGAATVQKNGRELARLGAGEVFGEMALLSGEPRAATVRAAELLEVVEVDAHALHALLERHEELAEELASRMASRQQELAAHMEQLDGTLSRTGLTSFLRDRLLRLVRG